MPNMPETHVMVDIETLGRDPGSLICSIGAVLLSAAPMQYEEPTFYARIALTSCDWLGIDAATVCWWMRQTEEARRQIFLAPEDQEDLGDALERFSAWLAKTDLETTAIWCAGGSFDFPILKEAYRRAGLPLPWRYLNERCYRTLRNLLPWVERPPRGLRVEHVAIDDALLQAEHLQDLLVELGKLRDGRI
jgi:hypothetical protein